MDEDLSWQAKLAKHNINILNVTITREKNPDGTHDEVVRWYYEFMYHPRPGQTKWSKTFFSPNKATLPATNTAPNTDHPLNPYSITDMSPLIIRQVATLRRELEEGTNGA